VTVPPRLESPVMFKTSLTPFAPMSIRRPEAEAKTALPSIVNVPTSPIPPGAMPPMMFVRNGVVIVPVPVSIPDISK